MLDAPPDEVDRIASWGGLMFPALPRLEDKLPFPIVGLTDDPLIIGSCNELGGASACVALRRLFVISGDMKVMGRPPGVVVPAS